MRLHLLRHAKTDQFSISGKDFDRELLKKGLLQASSMGEFFNSKNINPSHIFCSSGVRARQTIEAIKKEHTFDSKVIFLDELYLCEKEVLLKFLGEQNHGEDILIVGHNNGLSDFAGYLIDDFIDLKTCEFVSLEFEAKNWQETSKGTAIVRENFHPTV